MFRWFFRLAGIGVLGFLGYTAYDLNRYGYFSQPDLGDGTYWISFSNGLRAIVVDPQVAKPARIDAPKYARMLARADPERRYLGIPMDVPTWFQDAWSTCHSPSDEERNLFLSTMPDELSETLLGARFDAVCKLDVDGTNVVRGLIFSVPKI